MKRILNRGLLVMVSLAMAGCEDIPGILIVTKNFNVLVRGQEKPISTGEHKTSLDFKKDRVLATIETANGNLKVELSVPQGSQIPSNGNFELKSSQSGQPFDVLGSVQTKVTEGQTQSDFEACQKQDYTTVCDQYGCHVIPVISQGHRWIRFYYRDTDQAMQFDMTAVSSTKDKYAHFNGRASYQEKVVLSEDPCF